jgi:hypothetical protein
MKVRYSPILAGVFLALGIISLVLGLWLLGLGQFAPGLIIGAMLTLLGTLYLVRPYFQVDAGSVTVPALVGPRQRVITYETLRIDGGRLVAISRDGISTKVPVFRWSSHPADWKALVAANS